ncbi:farnesyl pyrophosphate synthase [Odontomachus brunneus]|uniref:farnesyl pyrophosphate synthase n=1 Tax=Odontomachus brunneus TaxID=486640 RepID=UPI0013F18091|nr:farnesyl pyrophosphate synthase [Odontomachus brunneus]
MSVARNRLLSTFGVARRYATVAAADRAHIAGMGVQRACSTYKKLRNATYWRTLDCNIRMTHSMTQPTSWVTSKDESRELMAVWPDIVRDVTEASQYLDIPNISKWIAKVLQYNVPGGKKTRGLAVVYAYKMLAPSDQITQENIRLIRILAWCVELLQAFFIIIDDIQDRSSLRRNQPCWYLHNDIGLAAINDGIMIESIMYQLLRKHFGQKDCYVDLLESFQDITLKTILGQSLDLQSTNFGKMPNLNLFTMDRYNSIVNYKTSYYTFILPITISMHFAGIKDREMFRQAKTILLEMGHFFQVQDDYLDCYGNPEVSGKVGYDIEEGKCTWLAVVALQRVTPEQRKILEECYGSPDPEKVRRVKQLYNDLGLQNMYSIYEEETYNLLNTHIQQISRGLPHGLFLKILEKIYRRVS